MNWIFTADAEEFAAAAESWLLRDPVRNTVPLTVLRGLRSGQFAEDPLLGRLTDDDSVAGAMIHTPPYPLLLGVVPLESLPSLAAGLIELDRSIAAAGGPLAQVEAFAREWWRPETGRRSERLYRLGSLAPCAVPGKPRTAVAADLPEAVRWFVAFQEEADVDVEADPTPVVSARINREELIWWEDGDRLVALAGVSSPIAGMSRIGPVYTPPELRRRGYGSAVTHAVTAKALEDGAEEVLLFTDLDNATSNSIYQNLGYRPVEDYASIRFD
ncbi:GNAT family N-acetyltransferase [Planotetraspora kaengkrachanensis]|uniref:Putative acetyltransferase n=1 Tax=Planotetraspora kaengkrachanensis TaxID=575193 RepID=A0A8J3V7I9_9ACTN|nr:GNAT family N-acetyltransferase [Planotetraspora kaengkrachanensis]GIG82195.1 putative acetyltransferase [Planotetraspora kaengkrachanensis]